jgi:serine/threonine-protein kinase
LSWEGAVKVSDFGIAKARAASEATASLLIKGKPAYMSPEQANGQHLDGRSDLFAVGAVLWEMLTGRRLFIGEDARTTLAAVLFGRIPPPSSLRTDVPHDLERVAMTLLERDLAARYATAEDAIADLMNCADAPRAGREAIMAVLAERFPDRAPVRHSAARARSRDATPPPAIRPPPGRVTLTGVPEGPGRFPPPFPTDLGPLRPPRPAPPPTSSTALDAHHPPHPTSSAALDADPPPHPTSSAALDAHHPPHPTSSAALDAHRPPHPTSSAALDAHRPPRRWARLAVIAAVLSVASGAGAYTLVSFLRRSTTPAHPRPSARAATPTARGAAGNAPVAIVPRADHTAAGTLAPRAGTPAAVAAGASASHPERAAGPASDTAAASGELLHRPAADAVTSTPPIDAGAQDTPKPSAIAVQSTQSSAQQSTGALHVVAVPILTVSVDGTTYGDSPLTIPLAIGKHRVRLQNMQHHIDDAVPVTIVDHHTFTIDRMPR